MAASNDRSASTMLWWLLTTIATGAGMGLTAWVTAEHNALADLENTVQAHGERLAGTETLAKTIIERLDRIERKLDRALEH